MEDQPAARGGGVEGLFEGPEPDAALAQAGDDRDQVLKGPAEPVQGRDDQGVAGTQVVQCLPEFLALHVLAGLLVGKDPDTADRGEGQGLPVQVLGLAVTIVKRSDDVRGFVVLPRRWVAERTFAWLTRYRRLVRIYERKPEHHEALIWWATVHQMTRRLTRQLAGQPPHARWSDLPPLPELSSPDRRDKVLQLLAAQPWRAWRGTELAAILGIENVNSFRVQLSQWSHQGYINKIGPALYGPMPPST
ncbi:hypothetical protein EJK15_67350 [Nonomuraea basaltis]|nr:hypothetical protein EJK15_67350 [Nonomuraea basaltis]